MRTLFELIFVVVILNDKKANLIRKVIKQMMNEMKPKKKTHSLVVFCFVFLIFLFFEREMKNKKTTFKLGKYKTKQHHEN